MTGRYDDRYDGGNSDYNMKMPPENNGNKTKVVILIVAIVVCVVLLIGTVVGVLYLKNRYNDDDESRDRSERKEREDREDKEDREERDDRDEASDDGFDFDDLFRREEIAVETPAPMPEEEVVPEIDVPEQPVVPEDVPAATDPVSQSVDGIIYLADVYESLTLRTQPSTSANPICLLPAFTKMYIIENTNDTMVKIITLENNLTGYVNRNYITPQGSVMQRAGQTPVETATDRTIYYADVNEFLTLRNAPSTSADAIAYLPPNEAMYVLEWVGQMAKVVVIESGEIGYVNVDYITTY